jgi:hypothetical protein
MNLPHSLSPGCLEQASAWLLVLLSVSVCIRLPPWLRNDVTTYRDYSIYLQYCSCAGYPSHIFTQNGFIVSCYCYCYWGLKVRWSNRTYCGHWKILPCVESDYHLTIDTKRCPNFSSLPNSNFRAALFRAFHLFELTGSIGTCYMRAE